MDYGILSLAVPLVAIFSALISKDVIVSLLAGIVLGYGVLSGFDPLQTFTATAEAFVRILNEGWVAKTILFSIMVGGLIALLEKSGAIDAFIAYLHTKYRSVDTPLGAQMLAFILGIVIFIESSVTALISGTASRHLCDRNGISRQKLAYICDTTSAPICSLVPLNAWGGLLIGLIAASIATHSLQSNPLTLLVQSIPLNFYALISLTLLLIVIFKQWDIGPMKNALPQADNNKNNTPSGAHGTLLPMVAPILALIGATLLALWHTGDGDILKGSGSTSVYYATIVALVASYPLYLIQGRLTHKEFIAATMEGMQKMLPVAVILLLAITIGSVIKELQTAQYISSLLEDNIAKESLPALIFLVSAVTAFSTGTSWGTFSIMMPIALTLGIQTDLYLPLVISAVVSGGIFGDHASPISDTTIISSLAADCDPIEHVRTQLPYALLSALLSLMAFGVAGYLFV